MILNNFISIPVHVNGDPRNTVIVQVNVMQIVMYHAIGLPSMMEGITKPGTLIMLPGGATLMVSLTEQELQDELATAGLTIRPN